MSLFQSNLRKQIRKLPKILKSSCENYSLLFIIIHSCPYSGRSRSLRLLPPSPLVSPHNDFLDEGSASRLLSCRGRRLTGRRNRRQAVRLRLGGPLFAWERGVVPRDSAVVRERQPHENGRKSNHSWDRTITRDSDVFYSFFRRDALKEQFGKEPNTVRCLAVKSTLLGTRHPRKGKEAALQNNWIACLPVRNDRSVPHHRR